MLRISCPKHPRYSGTRPPRASCETCIDIHRIRFEALAARLRVEPIESSSEASA